jgi:hypothetical protein
MTYQCPECGKSITGSQNRLQSKFGEWWHSRCRRLWEKAREERRRALGAP